tara:strand:+ start:4524 stop:4682 length:159 start_codon:yes stop_codon:yes gene_type:complete
MAIQKDDIKKLIYKSIDHHHSGSYNVAVSSDEKSEVNRIMGNFFSYVLDKHS